MIATKNEEKGKMNLRRKSHSSLFKTVHLGRHHSFGRKAQINKRRSEGKEVLRRVLKKDFKNFFEGKIFAKKKH